MFVCMFMHACEHILLVCDGSYIDSQQSLFIFSNFSNVKTFLYANRKLNVKK